MKLLLENWRKYQLLTEAQDICVLYESGQITEGELWDRVEKLVGPKKTAWVRKQVTRKVLPLAVALSVATGGVAGAAGLSAQHQKAWDAHNQDVIAQTQGDVDEEWTDDLTSTDRLKKIQDYPLSPAPKGVAPGFVYVPAEHIPNSAYLGDSSGYANAGMYRNTVKTNSLDLLMNQLFGKDSGAIFGGGDSAFSVEFEKTKDGKNILPLEWSLSYEAAVEKYMAAQK